MTAPPPSNTWKKASTQPTHLGWYERRYPLIHGKHPHPCPFDFWNGAAWLAGFPDNQGDTLPSGQNRPRHINPDVSHATTQTSPSDFSFEKFMQQKVTEATATATTVPMQTPEWVLAEKFEELTGVTPMAVHNRRRAGIWLDGQHCAVIARRLYVNIKEADQWIKNQLPQPRRA